MKRCCESCRFFQKGSLPGAGWCRHPERLEAQSDLVLVRSTQLACRKGWDSDYWEPISQGGRGVDRFNAPFDRGPLPPATQADIAALLAAETRGDGAGAEGDALGQDRVVGATPSPIPQLPKALLTRPIPPVNADSEKAGAPATPVDPRESILRAREVKRARVNNRIRPTIELLPSTPASLPEAEAAPAPAETEKSEARHEPDEDTAAVDAGLAAPTIGTDDQPAVADDAISVSQAPSSAGNEPVLPLLDVDVKLAPVAPERDPYVPTLRLIQGVNRERPPVVLPDLPHQPAAAEEAGQDSADAIGVAYDDIVAPVEPGGDFAPWDERRTTSRPERKHRPAPFSFRTRWSDARRRQGRRERPFDESPNLIGDFHDEIRGGDEIEARSAPGRDCVDEGNDGQTGSDGMDDADWVLPPWERSVPVTEVQGSDGAGSTGGYPASLALDAGGVAESTPPPDAYDPVRQLDDRDVVVYGDLSGPITYDPAIDDYIIAPNVPRMCRTCQSFRPFEGGDRGWCSNGWAFDNRQMVSAWDVPCASTLGTWWLPTDDLWDEGIFDRHAAPAPRFDRWMAPRAALTNPRSVSRRRRR